MTSYKAINPFEYFSDTAGNALEGGQIYIGTAGLDAQTNPIAVYLDAAETIPATQPIGTVAGYPTSGGAAVTIYTATTYSITVLDANGALVYSLLTAENQSSANEARIDAMAIPFDTVPLFLAATLAEIKTAANATTGTVYATAFDPDGDHTYSIDLAQAASFNFTTTAGVEVTAQWNAKALGATGDGTTDDSDAINFGIANAPYRFEIPDGVYNAHNISLSRANLVIDGPGAELINKATDGSPLFMQTSNFRRNVINLYKVDNVAASGHIFDITRSFAQNYVNIEHLSNNSTTGRILTNENTVVTVTPTGGFPVIEESAGLFFTQFEAQNWIVQAGCTAQNQIQWITNLNTCSVVTFDIQDFRMLSTAVDVGNGVADGVNCFYFESKTNVGVGSTINQIRITECGIEKANQGFATFLGCLMSGVDNSAAYDIQAAGKTYSAPLVKIGKGSGNTLDGQTAAPFDSDNCYLRNFRKQSGVRTAAGPDIEIESDNTIIDNVSGTLSSEPMIIKRSNKRLTQIGGNNFTLVDGSNVAAEGGRLAQIGPNRSYLNNLIVSSEGLTLEANNVLAADEVVIATGAVDLATPGSYILDTEGNAATDDLDTITIDGTTPLNGQILFINSAAGGRVITVKNGTGNINLWGGTDVVLDSRNNTLMLMYREAVVGWTQVGS